MMEWIMGQADLSVTFLLQVRLILSGTLLLVLLLLGKRDTFAVWRSRRSWVPILIFSIVGVLGLQYSFLSAIHESNSVVATLFQFSAPILVALYVSLKKKEWLPGHQIIGILGTIVGLFLLLTNGSLDNLLVSSKAIGFGIGLGLTFAFYTLYPTRLMKEWGIMVILGWGMLIGGLVVGVTVQAWNSDEWRLLVQPDVAGMTLLMVLFGTAAYYLFLSSLNYISPVETSILSSVEPLSVMVVSVIWFGTTLASLQLVGVLLMLIFVMWLSIGGRSNNL